MPVNNLIIDSDWTVASQHGTERFSAPFDGDKTQYIWEADYVISLASFAPVALDTAHPVLTGYFLVKESALSPVGVSDVVKWTRTYAKIPTTRNEYSSIVYQFIGYTGYISAANGTITANIPGRKRFSRTATCRIQYDYFLASSGQTYTTPGAIPVNQQQLYYFRIGTITNPGGILTWTQAYGLGTPDDIAQGSPTDTLVDTVGTFAQGVVPCVPTRTQYTAMVSAKTEIIPEASELSRWMGNIFVRSTKYVVAQ